MQVAVLSPHRDDAAFSCGLVLSEILSARGSLTLVNVCTVSGYAPYLASGCGDRIKQVTAARRDEDMAFVAALSQRSGADCGRIVILDLAWQDVPVRWDVDDDQALAKHELQTAEVEALAREFRALPASDVVLAPLALGGHVDHRLVRKAAEQAFSESSLVFYEDLPYACRIAVEERRVGAMQDDLLCEAWLPADSRFAGAKREFARCYPSQISAEVADEIEQYATANGRKECFRGSPDAISALREATQRQESLRDR